MNSPLSNPRTNGRIDPLGIDTVQPEFSWQVDGDAGADAFELEVAGASSFTRDSVIWTTGKRVGRLPWRAVYEGPQLLARARYHWRVRTGNPDGSWSTWCTPAFFETGILSEEDWTARWISDQPQSPEPASRTLYFRKTFELDTDMSHGRAYVTALGWYRLIINGHDLTQRALVPRWTPLDEYVEYQTYDVTDVLTTGTNVVGMIVADGRFRGHNGPLSKAKIYGDRLGALFQMELALRDGSSRHIVSDADWTVGGGRILTADPKFGERSDWRISDTQWLAPDEDPTSFGRAHLLPPHPRRLVAEEVERFDEVGRLPGRVLTTPMGKTVIDFGQNFTGVMRARLRGPEGTHVSFLYSEALTPDGELDVTSLNTAIGSSSKQPTNLARSLDKWFQRDEVILSHEPVDHTPSFTFHGFRYVMVDGDIDELTDDDVEGIVLSTDLPLVSEFATSNPQLEKLRSNVIWSMRSNFLDTPTDCPHRERSGWTGDIQVFSRTAAQLMDVNPFLRRYLRNLAAEQKDDGSLPPFVPSETSKRRKLTLLDRFLAMGGNAAGWGDAAVMLPWALFCHYGDQEVLHRQYPSAQAWHASLRRRAATKKGIARRLGPRVGSDERHILDSGYQYGEWLRPGESILGETLANLFSGRPIVATAYYAHTTTLMSKIATELGHTSDAAEYNALASDIRGAWRRAFVTGGGSHIGEDKQDDYVRALAFDLLEPAHRAAAAARLAELIRNADYHLGTGFLSTGMLLPTLADNGYPDVAYRVLLQSTPPSWLAQIEQGATTTWETWEGHDDRGYAAGSHNHYAFGAVVSFLHEYVAGLRPAAPGYRKILVAPMPGGDLSSASCSLLTPSGKAAVAWRLNGNELHMKVTVPPGVEAEVHVPGGGIHTVIGGTFDFVGTSDQHRPEAATQGAD